MKFAEFVLQESAGKSYTIDVQDEDEAIEELSKMGIKNARVSSDPESRKNRRGGDGELVSFTDTVDNKGMKWYVSDIGDDYGKPVDMSNAKLVKRMIKEYED